MKPLPFVAIFDIDGVVADSWPTHYRFLLDQAKKHWRAKVVIPSLEDSYQFVANGMINVLRKAGFSNRLATKIVLEDYKHFGENYSSPLFPGVEETLTMLSSHMKMAVVSSNEKANVEKVLGPLTELFNPIVTKESFPGGGKKAGLYHCLQTHGVKVDNAVFVGDTWNDYEEARAVRIPFVAAGYGWQIRKGQVIPDYPLAESFPQVGQLVLRQFGLVA